MTTTIRNGLRAVFIAYSAIRASVKFLTSPFIAMAETARDKKLVLAIAKPTWAYTDFSAYKEASIESRTILDSRGRVLAQVKLWIYLGEQKCYREVMFINHLLLASVGINRLPLIPLGVGKSDSPAALLEVTVRELETWLRNRTPGTQFGIEAARSAAGKPQPLRVVSVSPVVAEPAPAAHKPLEPAAAAPVVAREQKVAVQKPSSEGQKAQPSQGDQFRRAEPHPEIKAKVEEFTVGILQSLGMQERTIGNRSPFKQYCLDILLTDGESRGMVKRLWGADLERALEESHAVLGNRVEVRHHGSMPTANAGGGTSYKNSYSIKVTK